MSRNKFILILISLVLLYFLLPNEGVGSVIKYNMIAVLPYIIVFIIIYLIITINLLKRSLKKLINEMTDEAVINAAKMLNITFDTKRMIGIDNLYTVYNKVNFANNISTAAKTLLYKSLKRKKLDVVPPSAGRS